VGLTTKELLDREPTDTFVVQAEIYMEDRDEDLLELRQLNQLSSGLPTLDEDEEDVVSASPSLTSEGHGEPHLAAIYEEVAELRSQVYLPLFLSFSICS
jgi:hypothetical protein